MTLTQLAEKYQADKTIDGTGFRCRARVLQRSEVRGQRIRQTAHCQLLLPTSHSLMSLSSLLSQRLNPLEFEGFKKQSALFAHFSLG